MDDRRFRAIVRSSLVLAFATPAAILGACSSESSYPFYAPDAAGDEASTEAGAGDSASPDVTVADVAETGCVDDFDASPRSDGGVCGSDGRIYCSEYNARSAGVTVLPSSGCDMPCGRTVAGDYLDCDPATEYCSSATNVMVTSYECKAFAPPCGADHTCACLASVPGLAIEKCSQKADGEVYVVTPGSAVGRRPEGLVETDHVPGGSVEGWLAQAMRLEAASVDAFDILGAELERHGAPSELVSRSDRARADEIRHARTMATLARRSGAPEAWLAPPEVARPASRSLEAIAIENAIEGCVNETFGALLATWQAENARDAVVRRAMRTIAEDETRHAALAWAVAAWATPQLDADARARVDAAREDALAKLAQAHLRAGPAALVEAGLLPAVLDARRLLAALAALASTVQNAES